MAIHKQKINIQGQDIIIAQIQNEDYISLTDMAGRKSGRPSLVIANWLRNKDTIEFLGVWEKLYNPEFKGFEFEAFYSNAGSNSFAISPKDWIEKPMRLDLFPNQVEGEGHMVIEISHSSLGHILAPSLNSF